MILTISNLTTFTITDAVMMTIYYKQIGEVFFYFHHAASIYAYYYVVVRTYLENIAIFHTEINVLKFWIL